VTQSGDGWFSCCRYRRPVKRRAKANRGCHVENIRRCLAAAAVAAIITSASTPVETVANPLPHRLPEAIAACKQRPWPFLNFTGTNSAIRGFV